MKRIYSILILILVLLFVMFIIQNAEMVKLTFLVWGIEISKALLMMICAAVGFLIGLFIFAFRQSAKVSKTEDVKTTKDPSNEEEPKA
ncbi:MAG: LapA family protein [Salibacteraceae bacterium]